MTEIYIAFVDTPGIFAAMIRRVLKQKYIHVVLSLDPYLDEAYSVGRRNPAIPIIAGFEKEEKEKIIKVFPDADYQICRVQCTKVQKLEIEQQLRKSYRRRHSIHYTIIGLPFIVMQRPFVQKNHYTCSSYIAELLQNTGVMQWDKDCSCVTPKDFFEMPKKQVIFEGKLEELLVRDVIAYGQ